MCGKFILILNISNKNAVSIKNLSLKIDTCRRLMTLVFIYRLIYRMSITVHRMPEQSSWRKNSAARESGPFPYPTLLLRSASASPNWDKQLQQRARRWLDVALSGLPVAPQPLARSTDSWESCTADGERRPRGTDHSCSEISETGRSPYLKLDHSVNQ